MADEITTICCKSGFWSVNCFLIKADSGFILIDTGFTGSRTILEEKLECAGCKPGDLRLIVLTHGDFDHIGNCRYIRDKFKTAIAMHKGDTGMAEHGDMFWNRKKRNGLIKALAPRFFSLKPSDRFSPDIFLKDSDHLGGYGLDAGVLAIPGHSAGSIGILTAKGDLFCGDIFANVRKPVLAPIIDDTKVLMSSIGKLNDFHVRTVYPGHGGPFLMDDFKHLGRFERH